MILSNVPWFIPESTVAASISCMRFRGGIKLLDSMHCTCRHLLGVCECVVGSSSLLSTDLHTI